MGNHSEKWLLVTTQKIDMHQTQLVGILYAIIQIGWLWGQGDGRYNTHLLTQLVVNFAF